MIQITTIHGTEGGEEEGYQQGHSGRQAYGGTAKDAGPMRQGPGQGQGPAAGGRSQGAGPSSQDRLQSNGSCEVRRHPL